jgi:hypothetical protein
MLDEHRNELRHSSAAKLPRLLEHRAFDLSLVGRDR